VVADEVVARAAELHAGLLGVVASYYELAARYERLVATVDVFWEHLWAADDALLEVHDRLGLSEVAAALEAPARRFEEVGWDPFAAGRGGPECGAPRLAELRAAGERLRARAAELGDAGRSG
jgi:hypothetical protein